MFQLDVFFNTFYMKYNLLIYIVLIDFYMVWSLTICLEYDGIFFL